MSKSLTQSIQQRWSIPALPASVRFAVGLGIPLLAAVWVLSSQLGALPSEAWHWDIEPSLLLIVLLLAPVNWGLETMKWAELMPYGTMQRRWREVLYGTAWSLVGPVAHQPVEPTEAVMGRQPREVGAHPVAQPRIAARIDVYMVSPPSSGLMTALRMVIFGGLGLYVSSACQMSVSGTELEAL